MKTQPLSNVAASFWFVSSTHGSWTEVMFSPLSVFICFYFSHLENNRETVGMGGPTIFLDFVKAALADDLNDSPNAC